MVTLRALEDSDVLALYRWINDPELVHLSSPYRPTHFSNHKEWFDSIRKRQDVVLFGIHADQLIGSCQLLNISAHHRNAELQIRIGDVSYRGRGLGTQAVIKLLDYAEKELGLRRVYLHVFADNSQAICCYERSGMQREGVERDAAFINGSWKDMLLMSKIFRRQ